MFLLIPEAHRGVFGDSFSCIGPQSLHFGEILDFIELENRPQFSQPEVVMVAVEEEAMNMVRLHLSQTLALSMRTKLKVNYMLSTVCLSGEPRWIFSGPECKKATLVAEHLGAQITP